LSALSWGADATDESAVEIIAKDKDEDELEVRNTPEVISRTLRLGSSDTLLKGASSSSISAEGEDLRHLISRVGRLHLAKKKLSGCARQKLKKAREIHAGTGDSNQEM
jgi:hypothetical protein